MTTGIRVDIRTGIIKKIATPRSISYEIRVCERCGSPFEREKRTKTRFCSMSCAKKGQKNRLGKRHTEEAKKKISSSKKKAVKAPTFVKNNLAWAVKTYAEHMRNGTVPGKKTDEYGLYKYGEYLFNNETYPK